MDILDYDWLNDNRKFSKPMTSCKMMTKIFCGMFEKSFLEFEKMAAINQESLMDKFYAEVKNKNGHGL